jgi:hypothetical protein
MIGYVGQRLVNNLMGDNKRLNLYARIFLDLSNFLSQVVLCVILWDLGTKQPAIEEPDNEEDQTWNDIETASFDEDAELHAHIWRMFARRYTNESLPLNEPLLESDDFRCKLNSLSNVKPKTLENITL